MEQAKTNVGLVVLAIVIAAVVVGGGVYYWQNQNSTKVEVAAQPTTSDTKEVATQPATSTDLEKIIVREKEELFKTYDKISKELSSGYNPVIFSKTTDPAVRFTMLTNSGGDAMNTTFYFINQAKQKTLQVDTDVCGGDFGCSGSLTLSLNGGSAINISREQTVNDKKREIAYKGLRVNKELSYSLTDPIIFKPVGALKFEVLGVNPDLTQIYFSDYSKKFSYDIVNDKIQEVTELPTMAKPITK
ncbi:MAG: hypothetical protein WC101_01150 [Candidatus Gracilibacteria bacterium]